MNLLQAAVLGVVEGLTEFIPVSSTGHLTVAEKILGLKVNDDSVTGFTAVIQFGAILAVLLFFRREIVAMVRGGIGGLFSARIRAEDPQFRYAWYVVAGSLPIGVVGLAGKSAVEGPLRNLWVVALALIGWSAAMIYAERVATQRRAEADLSFRDVMIVGVVQCLALIPGVSRSGATISAGLVRGLDRVSATRLSFFLSIPALTAAGLYTLKDALGGSVGAGPTLVGTVVSFVVAYASIAWLLRFVAHHPITYFVLYRVLAGVLLAGLLAFGAIAST
jgi:undecaprenyl-diphosphatase